MENNYNIKLIPGFKYWGADINGNIWSNFSGKWKKLKQKIQNDGYKCVGSNGKYWLCHRLILLTFIGECPIGMQTCHNNGIRTDNRLENLRWDTQKSNELDKKIHGTFKIRLGKDSPNHKLTESIVKLIKIDLKNKKISNIAKKYNIHISTIGDIKSKRTWKHL